MWAALANGGCPFRPRADIEGFERVSRGGQLSSPKPMSPLAAYEGKSSTSSEEDLYPFEVCYSVGPLGMGRTALGTAR